MRLYLDHNVDPLVAADLRRRGFDVSYALEQGMERASDAEHLAWAAREQRTILTHDQRDFRLLATEWAEQGREHAGIIIAPAWPALPFRVLLRHLLVLLDNLSAEEIRNEIAWLNIQWEPETQQDR